MRWLSRRWREVYVDGTFNCTVKRLTDGISQFGDAGRHSYSTMSPFNSNSTKLLLQTSSQLFVTDLDGNVVVNRSTLAIGTNNDGLWSKTDPDVIYYHYGNTIKSYNVSSSTRADEGTLSSFPNLSFGLGEADLSDNGRYVVVVGKDASYQPKSIQVFDFTTKTFGAALAIPAGASLDWCDMTSDDHVLCQWMADGSARYQGLELFDRSMTFQRQVVTFHGHSDRARDTNGDAVILMEASADLAPPPGCTSNGIEKIRLSDSAKSCLLPTYWNNAAHVSVNGDNGFAVVEGVHFPTADSGYVPPSGWGLRYNEIDIVTLDGSKVVRLVHHRTRVFSTSCYYGCQPRAAVSRDGRYILFDSNYRSNPTAEYSDVYLVRIRQ